MSFYVSWKHILFRYANELSIGDEVLVQGNNELTLEKVVNVSHISMRGENFKTDENVSSFLIFIIEKFNYFLKSVNSMQYFA